MGQKHKRFREFRTPFPLRDIRENPRSNVRACAAGDGAICSKNRKIVPYHGANPNTRNGARLRSPSPIMAPGGNPLKLTEKEAAINQTVHEGMHCGVLGQTRHDLSQHTVYLIQQKTYAVITWHNFDRECAEKTREVLTTLSRTPVPL